MSAQEYQSLLIKGKSIVTRSFEAQAQAIANLDRQYKTDEFSQVNLLQSLNVLLNTCSRGGKVVLCGVGKSFKIACKLCATLNSLSIQSVTLHPTEALHGDLGILNDKDCIIMLTASGNTPELLALLPHIPAKIPIVLLTCNKESKLAQNPMIKALLYTELPSHLKEDTIHGIPAPTVSATLSLVMADSVILALAELIESSIAVRRKLFSIKHPGGSIGANLSHLNDNVNFAGKSSTDQSSSFSSFLSLGEIKASLPTHSDPTSSVSSDDEFQFKGNTDPLTSRVVNAPASRKIDLCQSRINNLEEHTFLKYITLYDFIVTASGTQKLVADAVSLKNLYAENVRQGHSWNHSLIETFQPLASDI